MIEITLWLGLTVSVEPPELETRVAILMSKAEQSQINLLYEVTFFVKRGHIWTLPGCKR